MGGLAGSQRARVQRGSLRPRVARAQETFEPYLSLLHSSNEAGLNPPPAFSEAAGVVSTARIERPLLHRGGSASTETMPAASPSPSEGARSGSTGPTWVPFLSFIVGSPRAATSLLGFA
jgi:hypothetical protein